MTTQHAAPSFPTGRLLALAVICLSVFVISVDATIVNVALPTLSGNSTPTPLNCSGSSTPTPSSWPA